MVKSVMTNEQKEKERTQNPKDPFCPVAKMMNLNIISESIKFVDHPKRVFILIRDIPSSSSKNTHAA
jgi:hypothetical protein